MERLLQREDPDGGTLNRNAEAICILKNIDTPVARSLRTELGETHAEQVGFTGRIDPPRGRRSAAVRQIL